MNKIELSKLSLKIYQIAKEVHKYLGPGLPYTIYFQAFLHELRMDGIHYQKDFEFAVIYKQITLPESLIVPLLVEHEILVLFGKNQEIEVYDVLKMKSYLKVTAKPVGIIISFNTDHFTNGYKKILSD